MQFLIRSSCFVVCLLIGTVARAADAHTFLVWYPGGGGSSAQAQPLMQALADYLNRKLPGTTWTAHYAATTGDGAAVARSRRPAMGIVSHVMFQQQGSALGMTRVMHTIPLAHGKAQESWFLVSGPTDESPAAAARTLFTTEPLSLGMVRKAFAAETLAPLGPTPRLQATNNLLGALKGISEGSGHGAIVSEREWQAIRQTSVEWASRLHAAPSQQTHPVASVVRFTGTDTALADRVTAVLRGMASDPAGRELLEELQLKGFE